MDELCEPAPPRVALIISADSEVGQELHKELSLRSFRHTATSRKADTIWIPFDLRTPTELPFAQVTYFASGITGFKACSDEPDMARLINVTNTVLAAAAQVEKNGRVILLSSCAAETHPDTTYGTLKLEAEREFLAQAAAGVDLLRGELSPTAAGEVAGSFLDTAAGARVPEVW